MTLKHSLLPVGYKVTGAMTRCRFFTLTASDTGKQADAAGQRSIGVGEYDLTAAEATAGKQQSVMLYGVPFVEASAAISLGDRVGTAADGRAKTAVATEVPLGIALKAAGAAGELIPVLLTPGLPAV